MNVVDGLRLNLFLRHAPAGAAAVLARDLHQQPMDRGQVIARAGRSESVWFPLSGAVSLSAETEDGHSIQGLVVGCDGLIGVSDGWTRAADWQATVALPGVALTMDAARFRELVAADPGLLVLLLRYAGRVIEQLAQSVVCARFHSVRQRTARWLLVLSDYAAGAQMPLRQETLARMVGAHRPTVALEFQALAAEGRIQHRRGRVTVLDHGRLESVACECYARCDAPISGRVRDDT